jgi:hypothetical protein
MGENRVLSQTMMNVLRDFSMMSRFTRDLPPFLRAPMSVEEAENALRQRLETRVERFLAMAERHVYGNPQSPYFKLLHMAGCEFGDLKAQIAREGLEGTLCGLAKSGVYVTFDEFKGRKPIVRGSQRFVVSDRDFDNPIVCPHFEIRSGGTRGEATAVKVGLPFIRDMAVNLALALHAHDLDDYQHAYWLLSTAVTLSLRIAKLGRPPLAWFYPLQPLSAKLRVGSLWLARVSGMAGVPLPVPAFMALQEPERMARWLSDRVREGRRVCLTCYASSAVRICSVAAEQGIAMKNVCFCAFGEPVTEVKRNIIESSGARAVVHYGFTEGGCLGFSCGNPQAADDVHFFRDAYALIQQPRTLGDAEVVVQAFLLTNLLSSAPKIMLNMDLGDHGSFSRRRCGCQFEAYGLDQHIAQIRSYEKLSGEGMTFAKTDILRILEQVLPGRFGGTTADYQLVEEEDGQGILRLYLIVSPKVGVVDETALRQVFLDELASKGGYAPLGVGIWRKAETLQIKRQHPVATRAGKILPFHLIKS